MQHGVSSKTPLLITKQKQNTMALFSINGYWNDDKTPFENYIVTDYHSSPEGCNEDEIFFYGLSEDDIKNCILNGSGSLDFTITEYKKITYKFPRVCSITGEGMWEGYCFRNGEEYAIDKESAMTIVKRDGYESLDDSYEDENHYYTEWEDLDEDGWYESEHEDGRDAVWVDAE